MMVPMVQTREAVADMAGGGKGRRPNGDGTIYYREDRDAWTAQVTVNGRRTTIYGKTQREVREKLTKLNRDRDRGLNVAPERMSLADFFEKWLDMKKTEGIKPKTWFGYHDQLALHVTPTLGKLQLARLKPGHVQSLYADLLDSGLSKRTVHLVHDVLHNALGWAVEQEWVARNVSEVARAPRVPKGTKHVWTAEQWHVFATAHHDHRMLPLFTVILNTCMRIGEALALTWEDVDLDCATMLTRRNRTLDWEKHATTADPKTTAGTRTIHLTSDAVAALKEQRRRQTEMRLRSPIWLDHDLVFSTEVGTHLDDSNVRHMFGRMVAACPDLPRITPHELRHTGASLLLARGLDVLIVAEMLGHADPATTYRVYGHVMPKQRRQAADVMQQAMDEGKRGGKRAK